MKQMMIFLTIGTIVLMSVCVDGHCQVPCGIFDDTHRMSHMKEDAVTIRKAMNSISSMVESEKMCPLQFNQASRWVSTKEQHASHIIETVSEYFLAQRVKEVDSTSSDYNSYLEKLHDHHLVMRAAMKTKQTVDTDDVDVLEERLAVLEEKYYHHH